ncbi:MAG: methylenetetrahydrofolate--tRNA-(uracil(54)-C(5))-methyltransferase (FADH(2)-oxidizing) TrmFO [Coriobacteriia bacterium]|nr:methylenetetrahydrofolate--tRNA-(uracil(54)-C(5))-methyltransferase (FADH(2)-oxidizing) TrmFO [Coriobacteriia bacterium]
MVSARQGAAIEAGQGAAIGAKQVTIIGAGLAGAEAAYQLAERGIGVRLIEMRPHLTTPAHTTAGFGELVCSNSFKSEEPASAAGLLKHELTVLGSLVLHVARENRVAAGAALAVDRGSFACDLTGRISRHPNITVERREATSLPTAPAIITTGPLTSPGFEPVLSELVGAERLAFYDASAPIVDAATVDRSVVFEASRYGKGDGADYLNAPMDRGQYERFWRELVAANRVTLRDFERRELFSACQPVEEIARTGIDALRFGALKPVGIQQPGASGMPWAVVQLRAENAEKTAYNLVGLQTNLTFSEQQRVFRLVPGLENADFFRFGVMHRNTFVDAPRLLDATLGLKDHPGIRLAGQLIGTEGYMEAAAAGLVAALNTYADTIRAEPVVLPETTVLGALLGYVANTARGACSEGACSRGVYPRGAYQPMHVNFGIIPPLEDRVKGKRARYAAYAERACADLRAWVDSRADLWPQSCAAMAGGTGD